MLIMVPGVLAGARRSSKREVACQDHRSRHVLLELIENVLGQSSFWRRQDDTRHALISDDLAGRDYYALRI